jgi:predicted transcriptional regulator
MKRTTIFLDESVERDLQALARRQKRPLASVVREALDGYVNREVRRKGPGLRFAAVGSSGRSDTAERAEELLFRELRPHGEKAKRPAGRATKR